MFDGYVRVPLLGEYAFRLRLAFERLGGLWIKLGQLLSLRADVFSREFCTEMMQLLDLAEGRPGRRRDLHGGAKAARGKVYVRLSLE